MKSGSRCSGRTSFTAVYSLVSFFIIEFFVYVGWQGHLSEFIKHFVQASLTTEINNTVALFCYINYNCFEHTVSENKFCSGSGFSSGFGKNLTPLIFDLTKKQKFYSSTCILFCTEYSCRKNTGIIEYKTISLVKIIYNIIKMFMGKFSAFSVHYHKA